VQKKFWIYTHDCSVLICSECLLLQCTVHNILKCSHFWQSGAIIRLLAASWTFKLVILLQHTGSSVVTFLATMYYDLNKEKTHIPVRGQVLLVKFQENISFCVPSRLVWQWHSRLCFQNLAACRLWWPVIFIIFFSFFSHIQTVLDHLPNHHLFIIRIILPFHSIVCNLLMK
jgi:hypothetical protein